MAEFSATDSYKKIILDSPKVVILVITLIVMFFASHAGKFRLDASADSLVLENDEALRFFRQVTSEFGSDDILILTYTPKDQDLFAEPVLTDLVKFGSQLSQLDNVASVMTMMNVPLIDSPPVTLSELSEGVRTLADPTTDRQLAKKELLTSPIYKDLIISADANTTALLVTVAHDEIYRKLQQERNQLRQLENDGKLSEAQQIELNEVLQQYSQRAIQIAGKDKKLVADIRQLMASRSDTVQMHLGGVAMITVDSIAFVEHDLATFSVGIVVFIILLLAAAFRQPRFVILPVITCTVTGLVMVGLLGLMAWPVTVVSSNFLSLMLIITLSLTIHLIVRYQEQQQEAPEMDTKALILATIANKFIPCFYTAFTTIVAFSSLIVSGIRPIMDFGWMMSIGVTVAFILSFTLFPAMLMLLEKTTDQAQGNSFTEKLTQSLAIKVETHHWSIFIIFTLLTLLSGVGIAKLSVENRFIDYYKDSTEIYQGMELIDSKLGGTTPLDVIIDAPASFYSQSMTPLASQSDEDEDYDDLLTEQWNDESAGITATSYWFNTYQLKEVKRIHDYLDSLAETGKVLSVESSMAMLRKINAQVADDSFLLAILFKSLPPEIKKGLFNPYMTEDGNKLRFSIRLFESDRSLKRDELVQRIRYDLVNIVGLSPEQVGLTGMAVLYNNMLQSLFRSQILTIGVVFFAILLMFIVLFRSFKLALLALIPNIIAAAFILGLMGALAIPLDLMTITIAAISIGIAVDNSIHYTHRFVEEYQHGRVGWQAVKACHGSIGQAMYFTSITVTLGFGILILSNFIPTIYFGLLTGFAMLIALFANLTLLPVLLVKFHGVKAP